MSPKLIRPIPIFDNSDSAPASTAHRDFITQPFFDGKPAPDWTQRDYEYGWKFIEMYNAVPGTYNAYRREVERLLQWCWHIADKSALELTNTDITDFLEFCKKPPLSWIGLKNVARYKKAAGERVPNKDWRPFVVKLSKAQQQDGVELDKKQYSYSDASLNATYTILKSFYNYLAQVEQVKMNPVQLVRQKSRFMKKNQDAPRIRRITNLQWKHVLETADLMAKEAPDLHERTIFVMNCMLSMYLRVSELVADTRSTPVMSDFHDDEDGNWWLKVTGKGNKNRNVSVSSDMLQALIRYRKHLGLTELPTDKDNTPLVRKRRGKGPITSDRMVRSIVQDCFDQAYLRMKDKGLQHEAEKLREATVHWLRHTGISEDIKTRPRDHVRDDAGHSSFQTIERYINIEEKKRHASGKNKRLHPLVKTGIRSEE